MSKIAIVTDSNSGITQEEGRRLGVSVIPMPFFINEKMYLEGITLSQDEFYQWLKSDASISTSQPSPGETMGLWDNLLKEYDEVVDYAIELGVVNGFIQEGETASESFIPEFDCEGV